jgi:hypothetical protein
MAIPDPKLGLVLSYAYLWHHQHRAGREEGVKDRPCVIVIAKQRAPGDINTMVSVVPVTHTLPDNPAVAFELPAVMKRHLGLDTERSWVILDEVNEFAWPGFDLRPVPRNPNSFAYGVLPPRLFDQLIAKLTGLWRQGLVKSTPRD